MNNARNLRRGSASVLNVCYLVGRPARGSSSTNLHRLATDRFRPAYVHPAPLRKRMAPIRRGPEQRAAVYWRPSDWRLSRKARYINSSLVLGLMTKRVQAPGSEFDLASLKIAPPPRHAGHAG